MRILILGATGFVGSTLLDLLVKDSDVDICATVNNSQPKKKYDQVNYHNISLEKIDLNFLKRGNYDIIFHLARISGKRGNLSRYLAGLKGKQANKQLLKNISKLEKKPRLVYLSGSLMYGDSGATPVDESTQLNPAGFAKYYYMAEQPLVKAIESGSDNVVMLRAPWIIGKGSWFEQLYVKHIQERNVIPVYGSKERHMSIVTVEDCAGMLLHYATRSKSAGLYNIYTFQKVSVEKFIDHINATYPDMGRVMYSKDQLKANMDKTTINSILCEVVLGTKETAIFNSYKPIHTSLSRYITDILKSYDK